MIYPVYLHGKNRKLKKQGMSLLGNSYMNINSIEEITTAANCKNIKKELFREK
jgi:hypothetical protein